MTINSMTGFARDAGSFEDWAWTWELKSVNAKGLDVRFRLPMGFDGLEPAARAALTKIYSRGNITAGLVLKKAAGSTGYKINQKHLSALIDVANKIRDENPGAQALSVEGALGLRGVIEAEDDDVSDENRSVLEKELLRSLQNAGEALVGVRADEGARLLGVLNDFIAHLGDLHTQATQAAETQGDAIRHRLKEQLNLILSDTSGLDAGRLEQEIALLMTKADIREELDRLSAHIASVNELMTDGGAVGRRLDFLCQELNREANTICSKAQETALTRIGLDMKATIEQFREQVQNIE